MFLYLRSAIIGFLVFVGVIVIANNTGTLRQAVDWYFAGR